MQYAFYIKYTLGLQGKCIKVMIMVVGGDDAALEIKVCATKRLQKCVKMCICFISSQVHMLTYRRIASLQATGLGTGTEAATAAPPSPAQPSSPFLSVEKAKKPKKKT